MSNEKKKVLGVIPARLGSTRIPEKMLQDIGGKSLIQRTIERTKNCKSLDALIVATDSEKIAFDARAEGATVVMWDLPLSSNNGTEGVLLAVEKFTDFEPDIIVNIWGDEPLYPVKAIDDCVQSLLDDPELPIVAAADRITDETMLQEPSIVQVLTDLNNNALLFSRATLPYPYTDESMEHYHVIGALAMRREFMQILSRLPRTPIEAREGVEQMRILEHGYKMRIVKGDFQNLGVNTPEELEVVRKIYNNREENNNDDA